MYKIITHEGQNIADVAIQEYAHTDGMLQIVTDNGLIGLDVDLVPGTVLMIQDIGFPGYDDTLRQMMKTNGVIVISGEVIEPGIGIGSDAIGVEVID